MKITMPMLYVPVDRRAFDVWDAKDLVEFEAGASYDGVAPTPATAER